MGIITLLNTMQHKLRCRQCGITSNCNSIRQLQPKRKTPDVLIRIRPSFPLGKSLVNILVHIVTIHLLDSQLLRLVLDLVVGH